MESMRKPGRCVLAVALVAAGLSLLALLQLGCGGTSTTGYTVGAGNTGTPDKLYVAVTGANELTASSGNMGYAIVDLNTKKITMVNIPESKAPHGIVFSPDTKTADNTNGMVAVQEPKRILLGNAQDGAVVQVDLTTGKATGTAPAPAGAKLAICGMQKGPDGNIWLSSMANGMVYPYSNGTISSAGVGGTATNSICAIAWSDGQAYLSQMGADANQAGYVAKIGWPGGNLSGKISNVTSPSPKDQGLVQHQMQTTPDGKTLYVADGIDGSLVKIDVATGQILNKVPLGGGEPHAIVFAPDGQTAYVSVRHYPTENESAVVVYDVANDKPVEHINGIPAGLICGIILSTV